MVLTPTARTAPTGKKMKNGWRTTFTLQNKPGLDIFEKEVKPVGYDGGDAIDTSTMWNNQVHTYAARKLIKGTDCSVKGAFDPDVYPDLLTQINSEQIITNTFPNGATICWYGFLKSAEPDSLKDGAQPDFNLVFVPTFTDPVTQAEVPPLFTNSGTG